MTLTRRFWTMLLGLLAGTLAVSGLVPGSAGAEDGSGRNVALASNGGVASSSGQEVPGVLGPELAIDGIADSDASRWSGEYADDSWLQVELADPAKIHEVRIRWSNSCPVQYKLQVSNDGQTWTDGTSVLRPQLCGGWEVQDLTSMDGTYKFVRMQGLERRVTQGFAYGYSINEIEVWDGDQPPPPEGYGGNVALAANGGVASSSGQEVPDRLGPELAIDGIADSDASRWSGEYADNSWWQVELAEPTGIYEVRIRWSNSCPVQYKLQVSNDGQAWSDATSTLRPQRCAVWEVQNLAHLEGEYKFVRMQGLERRITHGFPYGYSMNEFEVWNGPKPPPPPVPSVAPLPASMVEDEDAAPFVLSPDARIVVSGDAGMGTELLADVMRASTGYAIPLTTGEPKPGDIAITVDPAVEIPGVDGAEAYAMSVSENGVLITASAPTGAFYAVQTLRQLLPTFIESGVRVDVPWTVPAVEIVDAPRFGFRGYMLDLARSFVSMEQIKQHIDTMSYFKLNVLHLHLSDDQGWRIEITNEGRAEGDDIDYTRLTEISGTTAIGAGGPQNIPGTPGYLTQAEYKEIIAYAAGRHITVIPEIDGPAHSGSILHAIPQMNTDASVPQPAPGEDTIPADDSQRVGHTSLDTRAEVTYTFFSHVVRQLAAMTPGAFIHIGGDEGHSTSHEDYVYFVDRTMDIIREAGKRPMGWNEIAAGDLEAGDVIHYYNHATDPTMTAANERGADVVISWHPNTYLDYTYAQGDFDTYYNWDPMARFPGLAESSVLGVEAPLWTPNTRSDDETEYQTYPRLISTAEVGWTPQALRDGNEFTRRLAQLGGKLTLQDVNFHHSPRAEWIVETVGINQTVPRHGDTGQALIGIVLAPGTIPAEVSVLINWGDGSEPVPAEVSLTQAIDNVHDVGAYRVNGRHQYAEPGTYEAEIVVRHPRGVDRAPYFVLVLDRPVTTTECQDGGWRDFGFENQGLCVSFVSANPHAGKVAPQR